MISFLDQKSANRKGRKGSQRENKTLIHASLNAFPLRPFASFAVKDFCGLWLD